MSEWLGRIRQIRLKKLLLYIQITVIASVGIAPLVVVQGALAGQLSSRSVSISSAQVSKTNAQYTFTFTPSAATMIQGLKFTACTTALGTAPGGTCTAPSGLNFNNTPTNVSQTFDQSTSFALDTGVNCSPAANIMCFKRTQTGSETAASKVITIGNITNPSSAGTFYIKIATYTDTAYATGADTGTVATAIVTSFQVTAVVPELLSFCIGTTTVDDATTQVATNCGGVSGTVVGLGYLDSQHVNVSPVPTTIGGTNTNGVAMVQTNASNGVVINYDAVQSTLGTNHMGTMRVANASCSVTNISSDQCINAPTALGTFTPATENFGMGVAAVNCGSVAGSSYSCNYSSGTNKLQKYNPSANSFQNSYDSTGANTVPTDSGQVAATTNGKYNWDELGASHELASSTGVVDNEALILKFAVTPSGITPAGSYSVNADFVAVASF